MAAPGFEPGSLLNRRAIKTQPGTIGGVLPLQHALQDYWYACRFPKDLSRISNYYVQLKLRMTYKEKSEAQVQACPR